MLKAAVVGGIVAGFTAAAVLLTVWFVVSLNVHPHARHGIVIEGGPNGPTTTFTTTLP